MVITITFFCTLGIVTNYSMLVGVKFDLNEGLYNKEPQDTVLGKRILEFSVHLIDRIGFEAFTFKKLAIEIGSTEKSIYRYFENKHFLLLYLSCWYWEWVLYLIDVNVRNIEDPNRKLQIVIHNIINASSESPLIPYINENKLHRIIIHEGMKAYHVHQIDTERKNGLFSSYMKLIQRISKITLEINPNFPYSKSLSSNLYEMANEQRFFAEHLPEFTDLKKRKNNREELEEMLYFFATKLLA